MSEDLIDPDYKYRLVDIGGGKRVQMVNGSVNVVPIIDLIWRKKADQARIKRRLHAMPNDSNRWHQSHHHWRAETLVLVKQENLMPVLTHVCGDEGINTLTKFALTDRFKTIVRLAQKNVHDSLRDTAAKEIDKAAKLLVGVVDAPQFAREHPDMVPVADALRTYSGQKRRRDDDSD